ncbi:MAG: hypothetical protein RL095_2522 [Verrucomicrobiota bacterium]|jgi:GH35 family endo-1,4-beta-xylanase
MKSLLITALFSVASLSLAAAQEAPSMPGDAFWERFGTPAQLKRLPELKALLAAPTAPEWRTAAMQRIRECRMNEVRLEVVDALGQPLPKAQVRLRQVSSDFRFGGIINDEHWFGKEKVDSAAYRDLFLKFFNAAGFENGLKIKSLDEAPRTRQIMDWLLASKLPVRGHALIWPGFKKLPAEIVALQDRPAELRAACDKMIVELCKTWPEVEEWDVINEPRQNRDLVRILGAGEERRWLDLARQQTRPGCKLYINDYQMISGNIPAYKDFYEKMGRELIAAGAPLDGLGFQSRFRIHLPPQEVWANLQRFAALGLPMKATEFEVSDAVEVEKGRLFSDEERARISEEVLINYFSCAKVEGIYCWTFFRKGHGLKMKNGAPNWGYRSFLVDRDGSLGLNALVWLYYTQHLWRSQCAVPGDSAGRAAARLFRGGYEVEITSQGQSWKGSFELRKDSALRLVCDQGKIMVQP